MYTVHPRNSDIIFKVEGGHHSPSPPPEGKRRREEKEDWTTLWFLSILLVSIVVSGFGTASYGSESMTHSLTNDFKRVWTRGACLARLPVFSNWHLQGCQPATGEQTWSGRNLTMWNYALNRSRVRDISSSLPPLDYFPTSSWPPDNGVGWLHW